MIPFIPWITHDIAYVNKCRLDIVRWRPIYWDAFKLD